MKDDELLVGKKLDETRTGLQNTSHPGRRHILRTIGMLGLLGICPLAGCSREGRSPEVVIEYVLTVEPATEVPERVRKDAAPRASRWAVVEFDVVRGSVTAADLLNRTQVRAGQDRHSATAVLLTSPEDRYISTPDTSYTISEQARGWVYYRVPDDPSSTRWVVSEMESVYDGVRATQR